jgi:hypothetical protein
VVLRPEHPYLAAVHSLAVTRLPSDHFRCELPGDAAEWVAGGALCPVEEEAVFLSLLDFLFTSEYNVPGFPGGSFGPRRNTPAL